MLRNPNVLTRKSLKSNDIFLSIFPQLFVTFFINNHHLIYRNYIQILELNLFCENTIWTYLVREKLDLIWFYLLNNPPKKLLLQYTYL